MNVIKFPDKRLKAVCEPVLEVNADIRQLADEMIETMYANNGKGLAAPQVGRGLNMFVVDLDSQPVVFINPYLTCAGNIILDKEGCLSFPGKWARVGRYELCQASYTDINGVHQTRAYAGYDARAVQHEADHLSGVLIPDHLGTLSRRLFLQGK